MSRLVGLIRVPLPVSDFVAITEAFEKAWPGCTVGISQNVDVPLENGLRYNMVGVPIYEAES